MTSTHLGSLLVYVRHTICSECHRCVVFHILCYPSPPPVTSDYIFVSVSDGILFLSFVEECEICSYLFFTVLPYRRDFSIAETSNSTKSKRHSTLIFIDSNKNENTFSLTQPKFSFVCAAWLKAFQQQKLSSNKIVYLSQPFQVVIRFECMLICTSSASCWTTHWSIFSDVSIKITISCNTMTQHDEASSSMKCRMSSGSIGARLWKFQLKY